MNVNRLFPLAVAVLAAGLLQNASAQNWTGGGGADTLWSDAANWDSGVPGPNSPNAVFGTTIPNSVVVTITNGEVENVGTTSGNNIFGPQWGSTLNLYGTLNFGFIMVPVQFDPTAQRSVINMYQGSFLGSTWGGDTLLLGDAWFTGQPYVTLNQYGNSTVNCQYLAWGGHLNLFDQSTNIVAVNMLVGTTAGFWGQAGPSDSTRQINMAGGTFILPTAYAGNVTNWIERGIFLVYGKGYDTNDISIVDNGTNTIVTEPVLGTLQSIALASPRSTMMVGTFQNPVALGNFTGISGAVLSALDAAQLGSGTIAYHTSNPNVVSVSTNGHVIAVSPGTATISATLGALTSTNSVLITVTPYTNSLSHRYSFNESSGN